MSWLGPTPLRTNRACLLWPGDRIVTARERWQRRALLGVFLLLVAAVSLSAGYTAGSCDTYQELTKGEKR
jgi:hypothetical protein